MTKDLDQGVGDHAVLDALEGLAIGLPLCTCATHYHAIWGTLKAAGSAHGLETEAPVLDPLLSPLLADGRRVLIAGAADGNSLRMLHALAGSRSPRFSLSDRCPAPLRRAAMVADQQGISLRTHEADLADLVPDEPWDLVFLHYTLSFAGPAHRGRILSALARGLAPGGTLVCSAKFDAQGPGESQAAAADRWLARMRPRIVNCLADHPQALAAIQPLLAAYAKDWAARKASQPSQVELEDDFARAGLDVRQRLATARGRSAESALDSVGHQQHSVVLVAGVRDRA